MTVAELIAELQKYDPGLRVGIYNPDRQGTVDDVDSIAEHPYVEWTEDFEGNETGLLINAG